MRGPEPRYRCQACGQILARKQLVPGAWGDLCCPTCRTPDVVPYHTKAETVYGLFFLFRVF
jgi:phage FluMu protein Com